MKSRRRYRCKKPKRSPTFADFVKLNKKTVKVADFYKKN